MKTLSKLLVICLITFGLGVTSIAFAKNGHHEKHNGLNLNELDGPWQMTFVGNTGCGLSTMLVNVTLTDGTGTDASIQTHAQCGDSVNPDQTFTITSYDPMTRSGHANLSCGAGCGWELEIQVARDGNTFNMVDVAPENPNNFIEGTAVHK